jgi:hypothetical protein
VSVSWKVDDPESGIAESKGCEPTDLSEDTTERVVSCSATNGSGLPASRSVTVKIDTTRPTIEAELRPAPSASGWNNGPVTVRFTCDDPGQIRSGVVVCPGPVTVRASGVSQPVTGRAVDAAGNVADVRTESIKIDSTPPGPTTATRRNDGSIVLTTPPDPTPGSGGVVIYYQWRQVLGTRSQRLGEYRRYTGPITDGSSGPPVLPCQPDCGTLELWAYSVDAAGNAEKEKRVLALSWIG